MFGTAGHSVVYQGTASPGLSDASIGRISLCHFFYLLGLLGPSQPVRRHFPSVWGLKSVNSAAGLLRGGISSASVTLVAPRLWWHDIYVVSPRFEEEPNGDTAHSMCLARRRDSFNSD